MMKYLLKRLLSMKHHDNRTYLQHMQDFALTAVDAHREKRREDLDTDPHLRYALLHLLCLIGEAASRLEPAFRASNPQIPWRIIIDTRNRLIHGFDLIEDDIIWETLQEDLPKLIESLKQILEEQS